MTELDYRYEFDDITDQRSSGKKLDLRTGRPQPFFVRVNDASLRYYSRPSVPPQLADLVDLSLAIAAADRLSVRRSTMPCRIHIDLPVRYPEVFTRSSFHDRLCDALFFYTDDHWSFSFSRRSTLGRPTELQIALPCHDEHTEVCLWSGGLDSLAGLWIRARSRPDVAYVLIGTGLNTFIWHIQQRVAQRLRRAQPVAMDLIQVPLEVLTASEEPKNRIQRTRGFVFLLLGAVCALLEGQDTLMVHENGIGALNLAYRDSEVGRDHSRAVHPLALIKMSDLVSELLERPFHLQSPFLFWTKAEMCVLLREDGAEDLVYETFSCDSRQRKLNKPQQCGRCSSCLLRRQALAAAGIPDLTRYCWPDFAALSDDTAFEAMHFQVATLRRLLSGDTPWIQLRTKFPTLGTVADRWGSWSGKSWETIADCLVRLYRQYVHEWDVAMPPLKRVHSGLAVVAKQD
jgi:7-cyano-7-deazaguanine synthase in queuosine biosynthesis